MNETFKELRTYACGCSILEVDDSLGQYSGTYPESCKEHADRGNGPAFGIFAVLAISKGTLVKTDEQCHEIVGDLTDDDGFVMYSSKGHGRTISLCGTHSDPRNPAWNMRWPCPHAPLAWTRSRNGLRIHLSGCHYERISWPWATGKTLLELVESETTRYARFCKRCIPTADQAFEMVEDGKHD